MVDIHANRLVRTIPNLSQVHGVLVVPGLHRVYASATGANMLVSLNEDTGAVLNHSPMSGWGYALMTMSVVLFGA